MGFQFAQKPCQEVSQCDTNFGSIAMSNFSENSNFSSSKWKSSGGKIIQAGKCYPEFGIKQNHKSNTHFHHRFLTNRSPERRILSPMLKLTFNMIHFQ